MDRGTANLSAVELSIIGTPAEGPRSTWPLKPASPLGAAGEHHCAGHQPHEMCSTPIHSRVSLLTAAHGKDVQ
jgi:hypothetical protein